VKRVYKNKRILALIPARGGSKGLPRKNILPLLGKPLISWTIEQALNSESIDSVFVSTDDPEIAEVSRNSGINVPFLRPQELAQDNSSVMDAVYHVIDYFENSGQTFDILALLEPTSPLRSRRDIDDALHLLIDKIDESGSVVSLGEVHMENPFITKIIENGFVKPLIDDRRNTISQRQLLPKAYFPYGVIYAATIASLRKEKTFYQEKSLPYLIERWQAYEVDDDYDLLCVEAILRKRLEEI
jgi:CMP-N,N'-diacetyllegionaminic acid synthase